MLVEHAVAQKADQKTPVTQTHPYWSTIILVQQCTFMNNYSLVPTNRIIFNFLIYAAHRKLVITIFYN